MIRCSVPFHAGDVLAGPLSPVRFNETAGVVAARRTGERSQAGGLHFLWWTFGQAVRRDERGNRLNLVCSRAPNPLFFREALRARFERNSNEISVWR